MDDNNMNDIKKNERILKHLILYRVNSDDQGTLGILTHNDTILCWTIECPWRNNKPFKSCIPVGTYKVIDQYVKDVKDRYAVKFHSGNWAGDTLQGYRSDSQGCILPGTISVALLGQKAVAHSKKAMKVIPKDFNLTVVNYYEF